MALLKPSTLVPFLVPRNQSPREQTRGCQVRTEGRRGRQRDRTRVLGEMERLCPLPVVVVVTQTQSHEKSHRTQLQKEGNERAGEQKASRREPLPAAHTGPRCHASPLRTGRGHHAKAARARALGLAGGGLADPLSGTFVQRAASTHVHVGPRTPSSAPVLLPPGTGL